MQAKLKILMCSEASFLNSGFANYTRELLQRLYKTGKYDIAEFAAYGHVNDPKDHLIQWKYYANAVRPDDPRYKEYQSRVDNQFGRWRFDKVVLDFKPDVVIDIRDYWMSYYQQLSPFRKLFHWILMPTVDSAPQQQNWLDTYEDADAIFTYSDFGARTIQQQTSNNINYIATASPGINLSEFFPLPAEDKKQIRLNYGIPQDAIIIGSVMRNQKRKLLPELISSVRQLIDKYQVVNPEKASKIYLYLHTSYPDAGWDIPELLKDSRMLNRTILTYSCKNCSAIICRNFAGPRIVCPTCKNPQCVIPSVSNGISTESLNIIYNCMDIYVQYAICEGFGMPQVEAAACGIPIATVNYSAMEDIIQKLRAFSIDAGSFFKELETKAVRVYPDNNSLIEILRNFIEMSQQDKQHMSQKTRELTVKYYNWDHIAQIWEQYLDSIVPGQFVDRWNDPPAILPEIKPDSIDTNLALYDNFLNICQANFRNIHTATSSVFLNILRHLDYGFTHNGPQISNYSVTDAINELNAIITNHNNAEKARASGYECDEDYIKYSKIKASL
jgi:glycosyltransferase involved in cell wall biosynthesis